MCWKVECRRRHCRHGRHCRRHCGRKGDKWLKTGGVSISQRAGSGNVNQLKWKEKRKKENEKEERKAQKA